MFQRDFLPKLLISEEDGDGEERQRFYKPEGRDPERSHGFTEIYSD